MISIILILSIAFVLLAFFAGSEMAYLSCNKLKIRHLADEGDKRARIVMRFHQHPKRFITTILLGTNLMHVIIASLGTYLFETHLGIKEEWIITALLTPVIVIFAETIPKDWFRQKADDFIYRFAWILGVIDRLLGRLSTVLVHIANWIMSPAGSDQQRDPFVTRDEFHYVIEESAKGGALLEHEKDLINTILNLHSVQVDGVMVPVDHFPKLPLESKIRDVKELARRTNTQAILVYEEIPSLVVGLVYVFDILFETNENDSLKNYLKAPLFISSTTSLERALFLLQSKRASCAAVTGDGLEVIGVVHLENLIRL